jgi:AcrR family transcriptional regulator
MVIRQRAIGEDNKRERFNAIVETARSLIANDLSRVPSVDDLAKHAGLAKGTVYLYFPSKEELLLAVHTENSRRFFGALISLVASEQTRTIEDFRPIMRQHMVDNATFLPVASRCLALMDKDLPVEVVTQYKTLVSQALNAAARDLVRHFPMLSQDEGVRLFQHTYGTVVGLWQILHPVPRLAAAMHSEELACFTRDFETEMVEAIYSLWYGRIARCEQGKVLPSQFPAQLGATNSPASLE